ncbi:putative Reverse transcriptase (RNA-dependent DNA polymerase) [Acidithiobacillus ferrivorans]|uniref:RNA-directed DNA polymerase n=1 Tax=Acidithiobacillus ferrivorans TaxID=160808 RepID=A0A060UQT7_9PROT|nr:putative Reverse transcriptase (RNA-dependent DNA polymerase) [Acidithiobacillus ferrivorans]SMH65947.1 putative Reverse transcriptase (RNA-dependent DNA polymerase) [Acidithiobacillus ferrivorans]
MWFVILTRQDYFYFSGNLKVDNRTLQQAFNAVFHNKESFSEFCSLEQRKHIVEFLYRGRKVYKTSAQYKHYLRFLEKVVLRHLATNANVVHSYIKGKSALTAVTTHSENSAFFLTDIKSFFPNITELNVKHVLNRDKNLVPISDFEHFIPYLAKIMTWDDSIPAGFPTSPQLSNGFLFDFDNALYDFCKTNELTYTRYSDDIIISGKYKDKLLCLKDTVQDLLHNYASKNFFINNEKTRITHAGNKVKILGLIITPKGRVTIDSKYKRTIESLLHFYTNDRSRYNDLLQNEFDGKEHSLFGLLHYAKATDPAYLEKLQRKYGLLALRQLMEDRWNGSR